MLDGGNVASNHVIRNSVTNCTTSFSVGTNTRIGPIVSGAGGTITNTNPWANFVP